jgi:hypothetical protein
MASHDRKAARENYEAAHKILLAMRSRGALSIDDAKELEIVEEKLRK